jgi:hypothetical protein
VVTEKGPQVLVLCDNLQKSFEQYPLNVPPYMEALNAVIALCRHLKQLFNYDIKIIYCTHLFHVGTLDITCNNGVLNCSIDLKNNLNYLIP